MEHGLRFGKRIKRDICNSLGVVVLPAGTIFRQEHLTLLRNHRIEANDLAFSSESEERYKAASKNVNKIVGTSHEFIEKMRVTHKVPVMEFRQEILPTVQQISEHPDVFQLFTIVRATDEYTYTHNIGVGILSTLIGRWMKLSESDLNLLSLAATLHDVGKVMVPTEILTKPGKLTSEEYEIIKKHTIYGYQLIKATPGLSHRVALVALQHHERLDGKGYPFGVKGDKIDYLSKIVAVADIFHAMSSTRPYHHPIAFHEIISQMRAGLFGELDSRITSVFLEQVMNRTVGHQVLLTDGRSGEVVLINPHRPELPLVKINDDFIDLNQVTDLRIQEITI
ncbi:HD-GYP domain-containing protein [Gorillibacterium timonense]|uniref:HD-GYP domain-containing protein n=1 Tax=Gorillibacterium timonense TaxID=1689269 RepID=UPI00071C5DF3|nr:HD-GYP domain-containing protein [Gorillibacterium timonense]